MALLNQLTMAWGFRVRKSRVPSALRETWVDEVGIDEVLLAASMAAILSRGWTSIVLHYTNNVGHKAISSQLLVQLFIQDDALTVVLDSEVSAQMSKYIQALRTGLRQDIFHVVATRRAA